MEMEMEGLMSNLWEVMMHNQRLVMDSESRVIEYTHTERAERERGWMPILCECESCLTI